MAGPDYADRDEWPRYWRAIRRGVVAVLVVGTIGLVTGLLETAITDQEWRVGLVAVIAVGAFVVAQLVIDWLAALWERRLHR